MSQVLTGNQLACSHCGEKCDNDQIRWNDALFCCEGCKMVYQLLDKNGLCAYYNLNDKPGINQRVKVRSDKFAFLDDEKMQQQLISFKDQQQTHVTFYLPQIHCSSCLYLLENLYRLNQGVIRVTVNFSRREVAIVFEHTTLSLRQVAELLTATGYEPYISLHDLGNKKPGVNRTMIYQLGVAGFCFANIMLLSFPEYLGIEAAEKHLLGFFRILNVILALPVFFYSALPFYQSGWKGLQHKFLNIDAPIALAIIVTFSRSLYEVISGTGAGYFDSMSGIVFFMLVGRVLQDRTYQQLSFERDFTAYFPIAVTVLKDKLEMATALPDVKAGDTLLIHHDELIPADGILTRGQAFIDYSFVTGESIPVTREMGEIVYAGGKQTGAAIEILVIKEVAQSYLTSLWAKDAFKQEQQPKSVSFVHLLSRWFTWLVLLIAAIAGIYWAIADSSKVLNVITAVLIVACPCALLLSNSFTNGNILRILARNKLYLRSAQTIEDIARITHIVFDKTGTLTTTQQQDVIYHGEPLTHQQQKAIAALAAQSNHPLSRAIVQYLGSHEQPAIRRFREVPGKGIIGVINEQVVELGSARFITGKKTQQHNGAEVHIAIGNKVYGYFTIRNHYRKLSALMQSLRPHYQLSVITGDNTSESNLLQHLLGDRTTLLFNRQPEEKLQFIHALQQQGARVMMIGDGLNDAGALQQSDVGIAVAEDCNNFTPASDAIMEAQQLPRLYRFIRLCKANRQIVMASFILSIAYNLIGIYFALQGALSPLIAAILMPSSSLSILLITFGSSNLAAKWLRF